MTTQKIYDIIGIGIGPFNLGLAALCDNLPQLNCLFIDQNDSFNWHPGLMLSNARLQVPYYADLVSLAEPCNKYQYMNYLHIRERQFRFAIAEKLYIKRTEYNDYCRWVADQLTSLQFDTTCISIEKDNQFYKVTTDNGTFITQKIILGTGTIPFIPEFAKTKHENIFHSADYIYNKEKIVKEDSITIVGSGQSAAEIFYDLMQCYTGKLDWFTRSDRFRPMDYSKLTLEMSTPDYIDYFYNLSERKKQSIIANQHTLYKGINHSLISDIYDMLYEKESSFIEMHTNCELKKITDNVLLHFYHTEMEKTFPHQTDAVILATGYHAVIPDCIKLLKPFIQLDKQGNYKANRNYSIDDNNSIFIQNAEATTHGFNVADLSLGPYRNAVILNTVLGYEHYKIEKNISFQNFGLPKFNCQ